MLEATLNIGETFTVQFVWQLPEGDYIRAIFRAKILEIDPASEKYLVQLTELLAGRQESAEGAMRPKAAMALPYWGRVRDIIGRKVTIAYEAVDGRPLHMRLATLTGEHNFFTRYGNQ